MKLARFEYRNAPCLGRLNAAGNGFDLIDAPATGGDVMIALIDQLLAGGQPAFSGASVALSDVRLLAPIVQPSKNVLCIGKNYAAHAAEFTRSGYDASTKPTDAIPDAPIVFSKAPGCIIAAGEDILPPWQLTQDIDYEAELGVVIGKAGRGIAREHALAHVFGYTIINDVTSRDLQVKHKQWLLGKSIDTFCPMGPWIVTADELDPANLDVRCWVNDELRQDANTRDLIFDIPTIIETLSASMTLRPGDVIATGTPAGVGVGYTPPKFLRAGDRVRIAIGGIGEMTNPVR